MKRHLTYTLIALGVILWPVNPVFSDSQDITYQGILTNSGGEPVIGPVNLTFVLYDADVDGGILWQETINGVEILESGSFSVVLGQSLPIPNNAFDEVATYLGVSVNGDTELSPRVEMTSSPYSFKVNTINGAGGGNITSALSIDGSLIVNGTTTTNDLKIPTGAVDGYVLTSDIDGNASWQQHGSVSAGIAHDNSSFIDIDLVPNVMTDLAVVEITIPDDGYIVLKASCKVNFSSSSDGIASAIFQIDESQGGNISSNNWHWNHLDHIIMAGFYLHSVSFERVYQKSAGSYTFRLEGMVGPQSNINSTKARENILTAMYFPTSYGAVSATVDQ